MADLFFHQTFAGSFGENDWTNRSNLRPNDQSSPKRLLVRLTRTIKLNPNDCSKPPNVCIKMIYF